MAYKNRASQKASEWNKQHPERAYRNYRNFRLKQYGLSTQDYYMTLFFQNGVCATCGLPPKTLLHVDHNHRTNKTRKLLCNNCNVALGLVHDSPAILTNLSRYIEEHQ